MSDQLSNQNVKSIVQDKQGHIWIGTFRGLNKYDGNVFRQYFAHNDSLSIPDNQVNSLFVDNGGRFWVSTVVGAAYYDDSDNFHHVNIEGGAFNLLQVSQTSDSSIFINTPERLYKYDEASKTARPVTDFHDNFYSVLHKAFPDSKNGLWIVTSNALRRYDAASGEMTDSVSFSPYMFMAMEPVENQLWLTGNGTIRIYDKERRRFLPTPEAITRHPRLGVAKYEGIHPYGDTGLIIQTSKDGLFLYDCQTGEVLHQDDAGFPFDVPEFKIHTMYTDRDGNLWYGFQDQGYDVNYRYKERFNGNNYLRSMFAGKSVEAVESTPDGKLWIATKTYGLYVYDLEKQTIEKVEAASRLKDAAHDDFYIRSLMADSEGNIWMSGSSWGVMKCRYDNGRLDVLDKYDIWGPMAMLEDSNGTVWVSSATYWLDAIARGSKTAKRLQVFDGFTFTPSLVQLDDDHIVVGAFPHPLKTVDINTFEIAQLETGENDYDECIRRMAFTPTAIRNDGRGNLWVGSVANGLLYYDGENKRLSRIEGAPCSDVSSIEIDAATGDPWVSTLFGLGRYDKSDGKFLNYYASDGLGGNQFYDRSSCILPDSTMVFGGTHGLTFFKPGEVAENPDIPLLFEDIKIHNESVHPGQGQCIDRHLSYAPEVNLSNDQNSFSISFAALDYSEHPRTKYQYMLEGLDKDWVDASTGFEAYYSQVPDGCYRFKVRHAGAPDDPGIEVKITVHPAWWATWWAILLYVIIGGVLVWFVVHTRMRIKIEHEKMRREQLEKEHERRINTMNMRFFANVSHEFRTPLTMISGPVMQMAESPEIKGENRKLLQIVSMSVNRMLNLVNQMLDFNKLENDTLRLEVRRADIVPVITGITEGFEHSFKEKDVAISLYGLEDSVTSWIDEDKIVKTYTNLLSNALKFTPRGGTLKIYLDVVPADELVDLNAGVLPWKHYLKVTVVNSGQRIPDDKLEKIFERYYCLDNTQGEKLMSGSGIGLYYARALMTLHHGFLKASQPVDMEGAMFTFAVPVDDEAYPDGERATNQSQSNIPLPIAQEIASQAENASTPDDGEQPTVLVVDDDVEVARYVKALLSPYYNVEVQYDAESALKWLETSAPSLIISDVVMPGKDGYSFCRELKADLQLCHIPVILVTAMATVENRIEGLDALADAYVTKPFEPKFLLSLINSLLRNRQKLREMVMTSTTVNDMEESMLTPQDNELLSELYNIMEKEISNPELDVTNVSRLMCMSRTKFYYKIKGLTGQTPSVFFKTYKLNRAAELILEGKHTLSEIADLTGFSSLSHFSRSFKNQFGVSPSDYHKV